MTLAEWFELLDEQARSTRAWVYLFEEVDAVIAPAWGDVAFRHDDTPMIERMLEIDGVQTAFGAQLAWPGMALFPGLPATAVPIATSREGLPLGLQVIANTDHDHVAIAVARVAHRLTRS